MQQADSSCARDWSASNFPDELISRRVVKKTITKVNHKRKIYIKSAVMVFGYALILVFLCIQSATLGYQIENLQKDIQDLDTSNHRMDYQIAEKSSLDRIAQVAVTNLGMSNPDLNKSIAMEVKKDPVTVASTSGTVADDKSVSQKILLKMYSSLSRLAQNTK